MPRELTPDEARKFYDGFGAKQDKQGFYEDIATADLVAHAAFDRAEAVFEFGCGTGRFAQALFSGQLAPQAHYAGVDISPKMVQLAIERLKPYEERASLQIYRENRPLPMEDGTVDRFVSNYVFDLLTSQYAGWVLTEARRTLSSTGKLCLVSLTDGDKPLSRLVSWGWERIYRVRPRLVGGCHPVKLLDYLPSSEWAIEYRKVVSAFGIPSEVIIAAPLKK